MAMNNKTDYPEEEGEGEGATYRHGFGNGESLQIDAWFYWSNNRNSYGNGFDHQFLSPINLTEQLSSAQIRYWCIFVQNLGGKSFNIWEHRAAKNSLSAAVFLGHQECQSSTLSRMFSKNRGGGGVAEVAAEKIILMELSGMIRIPFLFGEISWIR